MANLAKGSACFLGAPIQVQSIVGERGLGIAQMPDLSFSVLDGDLGPRLLLLITMNVVHAPRGEEARFQVVSESWAQMKEKLVPSLCPLYDECAWTMIWEQGLQGEMSESMGASFGRSSAPIRLSP